MQAFIIGGLCIVNLQTPPKTVAKIKRISKKEKFYPLFCTLWCAKAGFLLIDFYWQLKT